AKGAAGASQADKTALTLTTGRFNRTKITGNYTRSDADTTGTQATTSLLLNTTPTDQLTLNSQVSRRTSEREGVLDLLGVDWGFRPGKRFGLDGGFTRQEAEKLGTDDAQRLRLLLGPFSLVGQRKERDPLSGPNESEESLRLEAALLP